MNADRRREESIEPLLRRALRADSAAPVSEACLDGETLAAWVDGGLDAQGVARAEAHVSGCARCQALVGVMARSAPEPAVPAPWWSSWRLRWLVPLAAGAAAVALWVMVPDPPMVPQEAERASPATTLADEPRPAAAPAPAPPPPSAAQQARRADESRVAAPAPAAAPSAAPPPPPAAPAPSEPPATAPFAPVVPPAQSGATLRARKDPPAALEEKVTVGGNRDAAVDRLESPRPVLERDKAAENAASAAKRVAAEPPLGARAAASGGAVAPMFRSAPLCGTTWQQLPSGVPVELTAGSSPSASVCWVIGRAGTVLLSTDGRTWQRVLFPEPVDLKSVQAIDARRVTVTTIDGRTFRTTDAGKTWNLP